MPTVCVCQGEDTDVWKGLRICCIDSGGDGVEVRKEVTVSYNLLKRREERTNEQHIFTVKACLSIRVCYFPFVLANEKKYWLRKV